MQASSAPGSLESQETKPQRSSGNLLLTQGQGLRDIEEKYLARQRGPCRPQSVRDSNGVLLLWAWHVLDSSSQSYL